MTKPLVELIEAVTDAEAKAHHASIHDFGYVDHDTKHITQNSEAYCAFKAGARSQARLAECLKLAANELELIVRDCDDPWARATVIKIRRILESEANVLEKETSE